MRTFRTFCNLPTSTVMVQCPLGSLQLVTCSIGVHSLEFKLANITVDDKDSDVNIEQLPENLSEPAADAVHWLRTYFRSPAEIEQVSSPTFCFIPQTTIDFRFADRVLAELMEVGFGETISYGELARRAGSEKASRAVGQVMKANPVCLIIPCHRVILKSGSAGHYAGGTRDEIKAWLLKYEMEKRDVGES